MRILQNVGNERVVDTIQPWFLAADQLDMASNAFSLGALAELLGSLEAIGGVRLLLPSTGTDLAIHGGLADRSLRNQLTMRWLAGRRADWLGRSGQPRHTGGLIPRGALASNDSTGWNTFRMESQHATEDRTDWRASGAYNPMVDTVYCADRSARAVARGGNVVDASPLQPSRGDR